MFKGANYVFRGVYEFFRNPVLWKYALIPLLITVALYSILGFFCVEAVKSVAAYFNGLSRSWAEFWRWIPSLMTCTVAALMIMAFILVMIFTAGTFYELFGGAFFDHMIQDYEHRKYLQKPVINCWRFELRALIDASLYSFTSLLILLALLIAGIFLPFIGPIVSFFIISYRLGVLYLAICNFRHGVALHDTRSWARNNFVLILSFGMIVQLVFWVPLLPLLLLPGVIIGGVLLLKENFNLLPVPVAVKVQDPGANPES